MSGLVEDRVTMWLSAHPGATVEEIARAVQSRDKTVREVLQSPLFVFGTRGKQTVWSLRSAARDGQGRAHKPVRETDADFLQRVLSDGEAHNLNEILRRSFADRGCGITVHSRAADLRRKRGLNVVNWKDGERGAGSWYRLVADGSPARPEGRANESDEGLLSAAGVPCLPQSPPAALSGSSGTTVSGSGAALEPDGQLVLTGGSFRKAAA